MTAVDFSALGSTGRKETEFLICKEGRTKYDTVALLSTVTASQATCGALVLAMNLHTTNFRLESEILQIIAVILMIDFVF